MYALKLASIVVFALSIVACSATTVLSTHQPNSIVKVATSKTTTTPRSDSFSTTSFGNYEFKVETPGLEPFYGILPLKFNGGYLTLDILFFAPAAFFNLREVYPFYEFDSEKKQIRYRSTTQDNWHIYIPRDVEIIRAKNIFELK